MRCKILLILHTLLEFKTKCFTTPRTYFIHPLDACSSSANRAFKRRISYCSCVNDATAFCLDFAVGLSLLLFA